MVEYSTALQECCFKYFERVETETLLAVMQKVCFAEGSDIFQKGEPAECLYFLISGRIAVQNKTGFGDRTQVIALLDPGAPVGEKGLLGGGNRGATTTAVNACELLVLSYESFDKLIGDDPHLAIKLLKWLLKKVSMRLEKNSERLMHVL